VTAIRFLDEPGLNASWPDASDADEFDRLSVVMKHGMQDGQSEQKQEDTADAHLP